MNFVYSVLHPFTCTDKWYIMRHTYQVMLCNATFFWLHREHFICVLNNMDFYVF